MILQLILLFCSFLICHSRPENHIILTGECEELRLELEGSSNASVKLSKLNTFLDSLGSDVQSQFWEIIEDAKATVSENLTTKESKETVLGVINNFEEGNLFLPRDEIHQEIRSKFSSLSEDDKTSVKEIAKSYGVKLRKLIMPLLPSTCEATIPEAEETTSQANGLDNQDNYREINVGEFLELKKKRQNVWTDYLPPQKREIVFINNVLTGYGEYRRRRMAQ